MKECSKDEKGTVAINIERAGNINIKNNKNTKKIFNM